MFWVLGVFGVLGVFRGFWGFRVFRALRFRGLWGFRAYALRAPLASPGNLGPISISEDFEVELDSRCLHADARRPLKKSLCKQNTRRGCLHQKMPKD